MLLKGVCLIITEGYSSEMDLVLFFIPGKTGVSGRPGLIFGIILTDIAVWLAVLRD
ncbi:MAG: hypothetical protein QM232_01805 [Bacteroidota bacterium]|nr:hypothetical protein [Bacteroidota bacterium]